MQHIEGEPFGDNEVISEKNKYSEQSHSVVKYKRSTLWNYMHINSFANYKKFEEGIILKMFKKFGKKVSQSLENMYTKKWSSARLEPQILLLCNVHLSATENFVQGIENYCFQSVAADCFLFP